MNPILVIHILAAGFAFGIISIADKEGIAWMLGKKETLDGKKLHEYHLSMWMALIALIATGAYLFWPLRNFLLTDPPFIDKMLFVAVLLINSVLIGRLQGIATQKPFRELTLQERLPLFASGAISGLSWVSATILAFFLF